MRQEEEELTPAGEAHREARNKQGQEVRAEVLATGEWAAKAPPCAICTDQPGIVRALWDVKPVFVCPDCYRFETGEEPDVQVI